MNESSESTPQPFTYPDIEKKEGEFERVAQTFAFGIETSVLMFLARDGEMITLDDDLWQRLENTDSNRLEEGDWNQVDEYGNMAERDWHSVDSNLNGMDAPIIMQFGDRYHLVAGNTRLMVARARGISPKVLLFTVDAPDADAADRTGES